MILNKNKSLDVAYIDFSRAFDSVVHSKLLVKLKSYGFQYDILTWIKAFLSNRIQCVVLEDQFSIYSHVKSGIAQGSAIGPLLFILYINDIVDLFERNVECKMFADDVKLYSSINTNLDENPLQTALESLVRWSCDWQLAINASKSTILHLGKKTSFKL